MFTFPHSGYLFVLTCSTNLVTNKFDKLLIIANKFGHKAALKKSLIAAGACLCMSLKDASIFVAVNVDRPGDRIAWYSRLLGRCVMDHRMVLNGTGPFLWYEPAVEKGRLHLWVSKGLCDKHPELKRIIQTAIAGSKWKLLSKAEYKRLRGPCRAAICTKGEISKYPALRGKTVFTKELFLKQITKVRGRQLGLAGMCQAEFALIRWLVLMWDLHHRTYMMVQSQH